MIRRPPRSTLFPSTPLFRSQLRRLLQDGHRQAANGELAGEGQPADAAADDQRRNHRSTENSRSEEHTSELQSPCNLVCRLLLEKKKKKSKLPATLIKTT